MTQITRNPFARASLMRATLHDVGYNSSDYLECKECNQKGKYFYAWESDRIAPVQLAWRGPFCSVGCYRAYFNP